MTVLPNSPHHSINRSVPTACSSEARSRSQLMKWAVELGQFKICYLPRASVKGEALADFVVEHTGLPNSEQIEELEPQSQTPSWKLFTDGSSNEHHAEAGVILTLEGHHSNAQSDSISRCPTTKQSMKHCSQCYN